MVILAAVVIFWFWLTRRSPGVIEHGIARALAVILAVAAVTLPGVGVTLTSVGAGALGVVVLLVLYPLRLSPAQAREPGRGTQLLQRTLHRLFFVDPVGLLDTFEDTWQVLDRLPDTLSCRDMLVWL